MQRHEKREWCTPRAIEGGDGKTPVITACLEGRYGKIPPRVELEGKRDDKTHTLTLDARRTYMPQTGDIC